MPKPKNLSGKLSGKKASPAKPSAAPIRRAAPVKAPAIAAPKKAVSSPSPASTIEDRLNRRLVSPVAVSPRSRFAYSGDFPPTEEQDVIIETAVSGAKVVVVVAGAGTGKTTTLRFLADNLRGNGQYTAFNTKLVQDSASKFQGTRVAANTTHSLAYKAIGKQYAHRLNGQRIRSEQVAAMLDLGGVWVETMPEVGDVDAVSKFLKPGFLAGQVIRALGRFAQSADKEIGLQHFRYIDGIDIPKDSKRTYKNNDDVKNYLLPFAQRAWEDIESKDGGFPFSHDYYVKLWQLGNPVIPADYILLDEAQDSAPVLLDIVSRQDGQLILVGDSAQQIYDWRGAVDALKAFPDAPRVYLSQSFRFGPAIADVANMILESLAEKTPLRLKGFDKINSTLSYIENPTAVLTRTNAVAVGMLLEAFTKGKQAFLVGGGADVASFVRGALALQNGKHSDHPDLACFNSWFEVQEYVKNDEGEDLELLVKLIDGFGADTILHALEAMPDEKDAELVISTAHKSKGRQWERVVLGTDFPAARWPSMAPDDGDRPVPNIDQISDSDKRLAYVAVTRAQNELDITSCPFFTGERVFADYKGVAEQIRANPPKKQYKQSTGPSPNAEDKRFSWSKFEDRWVVRGPSGKAGEWIDVERKDKSTSRRKLGREIKEVAPGVALYE
jgi:superfamily I DNA/RNA helicase